MGGQAECCSLGILACAGGSSWQNGGPSPSTGDAARAANLAVPHNGHPGYSRSHQAACRGLPSRRAAGVRTVRQRGPRVCLDREGGSNHPTGGHRLGAGARGASREHRRCGPKGRARHHPSGPERGRRRAIPSEVAGRSPASASSMSRAIAANCDPALCEATASPCACAKSRPRASLRSRRSWTVLARRGVPNYFGPQRFGMRGDTWEVGCALVAGDFPAAVDLVVGQPCPQDPAPVRRARELAAAGHYREAAGAWPRGFADCARLCRLLDRANGDARQAVLALDRSVLGFYVSAYQGWLFNRVVAERVTELDRLVPGDILFSHKTGLCARLVRRRRGASPSGPIRDLSDRPHRGIRHDRAAGRGRDS